MEAAVVAWQPISATFVAVSLGKRKLQSEALTVVLDAHRSHAGLTSRDLGLWGVT